VLVWVLVANRYCCVDNFILAYKFRAYFSRTIYFRKLLQLQEELPVLANQIVGHVIFTNPGNFSGLVIDNASPGIFVATFPMYADYARELFAEKGKMAAEWKTEPGPPNAEQLFLHYLKTDKEYSAIFLSRYTQPLAGSVVMITWEGSRPLLIEVQALVNESHFGSSRRVTVGFVGFEAAAYF